MNYVDWMAGRGKLVTPTSFIANGCGPKAGKISSALIPNELVGVQYADCCDAHDLAYAQGGFWGLFYRKPRADLALAACLYKHFHAAAAARINQPGFVASLAGIGTEILGWVLAPVYAIVVTLLGWTPFTWRWRFVELRPLALLALKNAWGSNDEDAS